MVISCQPSMSTTNHGQLIDRSATNYDTDYTNQTVSHWIVSGAFTNSIGNGADNEI